jgi:hypothetical protein
LVVGSSPTRGAITPYYHLHSENDPHAFKEGDSGAHPRGHKIDVSKVDVSMNGIELQDREFLAAIREKREPNASVHQVLPCYRTVHELDQQLNKQD